MTCMTVPTVIAESTTEPIGLAEAALNLRLTPDDDNSPQSYTEGSRILQLITAARRTCEEELEMSLVAKTLEIALESFHRSYIQLPYGPVRSIVSVTYVDTDGVETVLAADQYRLSTSPNTEGMWRAYQVTWPAVRYMVDAVLVRYTVGYPSDDSPVQTVPEPIRQAMHLYISHWFANREAVDADNLAELPIGARYLLGKYRKGMGV